MARTRKERHKWKRKERQRAGKGDPAKIKLHRERFLSRLRAGNFKVGNYQAIVLHCRLEVDEEFQETVLVLDGEEIESLPFVVTDVSSIRHHLTTAYPEFNPNQEAQALSAHVAKVKATKKVCQLEKIEDEIRVCKSVIDCQYRKITENQSVAVCSR